MVSTRVGYAGGTSTDPTYHNLENHSETIEITFDPAVISYQELLDVFWGFHDPTRPPYSTQYASIIFYHDEGQKAAAEASMAERQRELGRQLYTAIRPAGPFYQAEDYHQKYYLSTKTKVVEALRAVYPDFSDYVASTAAARLNGHAGGFISAGDLVSELERLGFERDTIARILEAAGESVAAYCPAPSSIE